MRDLRLDSRFFPANELPRLFNETSSLQCVASVPSTFSKRYSAIGESTPLGCLSSLHLATFLAPHVHLLRRKVLDQHERFYSHRFFKLSTAITLASFTEPSSLFTFPTLCRRYDASAKPSVACKTRTEWTCYTRSTVLVVPSPLSPLASWSTLRWTQLPSCHSSKQH